MTEQHSLPQRNGVSALKIGKPSIVLALCIAALSVLGMPTAQAKQQCSSATPTNSHGYWSWRLVDGRKCWYEGKPGLSKSSLEWPKEKSKQPASRREVTGTITEKRVNPLDSTAPPKGSDTLGRFGDWTITKNDAVIALHSNTGNLALTCSDATMTYLASIRISDTRSIAARTGVKPSPYFNFKAWADSNEPAAFTFLVGRTSDAYATGIVPLNPEFADQNTKFWAMLKSARSRFSYSTSAGIVSLNAVDLSAAVSRFQEECFEIFKANAHHRLNEPIPLDWLRD